MGIEAINGPVRSEPLNRNFSYLDSETSKNKQDFTNLKERLDTVETQMEQTEQDVTALKNKTKGIKETNVFIGDDAGKENSENPVDEAPGGGYRNVGIGNKALENNQRGWKNTAVGWAALRDNKGGYNNVAIGDSALEHNIGDNGPTGTDPEDTGSRNTAVGSYALRYNTVGRGNVAIGRNSAHTNVDGNYNTAVGTNAYSGSATDGTNHTPKSGVYNNAFGYNSLFYNETGNDNTALGKEAGYWNKSGDKNTYVGNSAGRWNGSGNRNVAVGYSALLEARSGADNTAVGTEALSNATQVTSSTALGDNALKFDIDGNPLTSGDHMVGIGKQSRVSGDKQLQLGTSGITTYAYGAVQNRSDARDKTAIRDTKLGLWFIEKLRPVDFKWDYRDDYVEFYEEEVEVVDADGNKRIETVTKARKLPKDGSKKRKRYHHGLIAQDIQKIIEETGIDFGGFQDHKINGGNDVLSIGYEELIAPLIKAVQELSARVKELEKNAEIE